MRTSETKRELMPSAWATAGMSNASGLGSGAFGMGETGVTRLMVMGTELDLLPNAILPAPLLVVTVMVAVVEPIGRVVGSRRMLTGSGLPSMGSVPEEGVTTSHGASTVMVNVSLASACLPAGVGKFAFTL